MGLRFIFMLTRNDRTVADAQDQLAQALAMGVRHIGFKDIGLPVAELKRLNATIRAAGATSYLEVVSLDRDSEIASARAACDIGVDVLLGGTRVDDVLPVIAGSGLHYCPFPGRIVGHPSVLEGSIAEIVASAVDLAARPGVHGLDLLAYRSAENVPELMRAVCAAVTVPVYVAGSIESPEQIAIVGASGAAGFTIGTAALDGRFPAPATDVASQLAAIIRSVAEYNGHVSPYHTEHAAASLHQIVERWAPATADVATDLSVRRVTIGENAKWAFHTDGDEMLIVQRGRVQMHFRDRAEMVEAGELIVIPRGVEHRPLAVQAPCEGVLIRAARG